MMEEVMVVEGRLNSLKWGVILLLLLVEISGCSPDPQIITASGILEGKTDGLVSVNFKPQVADQDFSNFSPEKRTLLEAIRSGRRVDHGLLGRLLVEEHAREFDRRQSQSVETGDFYQFLALITEGFRNPHRSLSGAELGRMKSHYEERRQLYHDQTATSLEHTATSVFDVQRYNRLQFYSGTVLHQLALRRLLSGIDFQSGNHVVIFESGHILPGYVSAEDDGFHLYGIETTRLNREENPVSTFVYYGRTDELQKNGVPPLRVVDATDFAAAEIFKRYLTNPDEVVQQMIDYTEIRYNVMSLGADRTRRRMSKQLDAPFAQSPVAFGIPHLRASAPLQEGLLTQTRGNVQFKRPQDPNQILE